MEPNSQLELKAVISICVAMHSRHCTDARVVCMVTEADANVIGITSVFILKNSVANMKNILHAGTATLLN